MDEKQKPLVQCVNCKHYVGEKSNSSCSINALKLIKNMYVAIEGDSGPNFDIDKYKYACKVINNDPAEFDKIDPTNCKYFLSNKFTFLLG